MPDKKPGVNGYWYSDNAKKVLGKGYRYDNVKDAINERVSRLQLSLELFSGWKKLLRVTMRIMICPILK